MKNDGFSGLQDMVDRTGAHVDRTGVHVGQGGGGGVELLDPNEVQPSYTMARTARYFQVMQPLYLSHPLV